MAKDDATDKSPDVQDNADADAAEDRARTEALEDRGTLADRDRQQRADAKAGKPTGITGEFGALELGQSKDAAQVSLDRNARNQVSRVEYPDGTSKTFEYGPDNQLSRSTDQNGWSWRKENDGWQLYNSTNERTETRLEGDIKVDQQGNFIFEHTDHTKEISRPDGSYRREYANGGNFERNAQNQVTSIQAADGSTKQLEYGQDGRLMRETHQDGSSWRRDNDGWHLYDSSGRRGEALQGDIEVNAQGQYIFKHTNGMRETSGADGSYIRHEPNGDVSRVTYPDGTNKQFTYGPGGRLDAYTDQSGSTWRREAGAWNLYNNQQPPQRTGEPLQGDIEVDRQGTFTFVHRDGTRESTGADGRTTRTPARR